MSGINAATGEVMDGFSHVEQSLGKIMFTMIGERVMREWFGNPGLRLLGENMTQPTIARWFASLYAVVSLFEPRFHITRFEVNDLDALGIADFTMVGEYRPYAHLDWQQVRAFVSVSDQSVTIKNAT